MGSTQVSVLRRSCPLDIPDPSSHVRGPSHDFVLGPAGVQEARSDGHPIVVIAGRDIVDILKQHGYGTAGEVRRWLASTFPGAQTRSVIDTPAVS